MTLLAKLFRLKWSRPFIGLVVFLVVSVAVAATIAIRADSPTSSDNECLPVVSIERIDGEMTERKSDEPQDNATFKVSYSNELLASTLQVDFALGGSAKAYADYKGVAENGVGFSEDNLSVTFTSKGPKQKIVTLQAVDDTIVEDTESVVLVIKPSDAFTVQGTRRVEFSIIDNDQPIPTVSVTATDAAANEVNNDTGTFTFKSSKKLTTDLAIQYEISGTASNGTDYQTISSPVTISAGQLSQIVTIQPIDDTTKDEGDETVIVTIKENTASYKISNNASAQVTIGDDDSDSLSTVSVATIDGTAVESIGNDPGQFVFTRTGGTMSQSLTVAFTMTGSATLNTDYSLDPGGLSVTFSGTQSNQQTVAIKVTALRDSLRDELTESAVLTLAPSNKYKIGTPAFVVVDIINNPQVAFQTMPLIKKLANFIKPSVAHAETKECGTIEGKVYGKSKNGAKTALKDATVTLKNSGGTKIKDPVKTDSLGKFRFDKVPVEFGKDNGFKVEAEASGYKPNNVTVVLSPPQYKKDNVEIVLEGIDGLKLTLLGQTFGLDSNNKPIPKPKTGIGQAEISFSCGTEVKKTTDGNGTVALTNDEIAKNKCNYPLKAKLLDDPTDENKPSFAYLFDPREINLPNAGEYTMEGSQPFIWGQVYEDVTGKRTPPVAPRIACVALKNDATSVKDRPEQCNDKLYRSGQTNGQGYYQISIPWGLVPKYAKTPAVGVVECMDASHEIVSADPINARDPNANRHDIKETRY